MKKKLALGTVQLGQTYGIANQIGQPNKQKAVEILKYAVKHGIMSFDTAPGYGQSEEIIGFFLKEEMGESLNIITKIPSVSENNIDEIEKSIRASQKKLGIESLYGVLFHDANVLDKLTKKDCEWIERLKEKYHIDKMGISIYSPEQVKRVIELGIFDIIQVPMNVFDLRLINEGLLQELSNNKIEIHVRSVYLQGLLFLEEQELPNSLKAASPYLLKLKEIAAREKLKISELAFLFIRDNSYVDKMIVGCESLEQLRENIRISELPTLSSSIMDEINISFRDIPENIINPSKWRD
ncbi:aldo/keto reductase [Niallia circulans]|nr:aldo/keto reductase [Niallia circulans]NRG33237.1 aldo/keto reductase [Niallia circulans]